MDFSQSPTPANQTPLADAIAKTKMQQALQPGLDNKAHDDFVAKALGNFGEQFGIGAGKEIERQSPAGRLETAGKEATLEGTRLSNREKASDLRKPSEMSPDDILTNPDPNSDISLKTMTATTRAAATKKKAEHALDDSLAKQLSLDAARGIMHESSYLDDKFPNKTTQEKEDFLRSYNKRAHENVMIGLAKGDMKKEDKLTKQVDQWDAANQRSENREPVRSSYNSQADFNSNHEDWARRIGVLRRQEARNYKAVFHDDPQSLAVALQTLNLQPDDIMRLKNEGFDTVEHKKGDGQSSKKLTPEEAAKAKGYVRGANGGWVKKN